MSQLTPGFVVAHSHRLEDLTDIAVSLMSRYPLEPFADDVVLVQSNGIAQWLKIELARANGIASMLDISLPARFVWRAYRTVLGDQIPRFSPYDKNRLRWRLMRLLPVMMKQNEHFQTLAGYIKHDPDQRKLFQLSERLADLFDQYQVYRADWLDNWANGDNTIHHRGQSIELDATTIWQPALWRALVADIGAEEICSNRAALHQQFLTIAGALQERPDGLPPRLIVFGISSLPRQTLEVLNALKGVCQIMLCVHNPCQFHWADIIDGRDLFIQHMRSRHTEKTQSLRAVKPEELHLHAHPLLASWGKQGRDYIRLLDEFDETQQKAADFAALRFDLFDEVVPVTLLQQLQSDILHLRPLSETRETWQETVNPDDVSICFHRCHSAQREVEVLHDQLLAAFAADPHLHPREIIVMVPDINTYAPYIDAVFGQYSTDDSRYIPFTLADQSQRHRHPLLIALEFMLAAPQQRFTYSDVFDLLHVTAVQRRFRLEPAHIEQLQQWAAGSGARWGLHSEHRRSVGIEYSYQENTWQFALQRLLYGYAAGEVEGNPWHDIEPYTEASGTQASALGGLAELIRTVEMYCELLREPRTVKDWYPLLNALLDDLFLATEDAEYVIIGRLRDVLDEWLESAEEAEFEDPVRFNIVQDVWLSAMDESGLNQRFMAGSVNFATLMPMRAIPFKQVCLLGMNETDYPRRSQPADFDLMAGHYQPGDRSRRDDDRYLFLEALLSARQQLYISWIGLSAQDNSELAPSILIGQLRDHLDAGWSGSSDPALSERLTVTHRLQPFSPVYFNAATPDVGGMFTYAHEWSGVYKTAQSAQPATAMALADFNAEAPFTLKDLEVWFSEPAQLLARHRLGVRISAPESTLYDNEVFSADGLSYWAVKYTLMQAALTAQPQSNAQLHTLLHQRAQRLRREGHLPYGHGADDIESSACETVAHIYSQMTGFIQQNFEPIEPLTIQADFRVFQVEDELTSLYRHTADATRWLYIDVRVSQVVEQKPRSTNFRHTNLCHGWLAHLYATVSVPDSVQLETLVIGEGGAVRFQPVSYEAARSIIDEYTRLITQALCQPMPVALTLAKWLEGSKPLALSWLQTQYEGSSFVSGAKQRLPYLARHFPSAADLYENGFEQLCADYYSHFFAALENAVVETPQPENLQGAEL